MTSPPESTRPDDRPFENNVSAWSRFRADAESRTSIPTPNPAANDKTPELAWNPTLSLPDIVADDFQPKSYDFGSKGPRIVPKRKPDNKPSDETVVDTTNRPPKRKRRLSGPRFACPFLKHNPAAHDADSVCRGAGFPNLPNLKQHLFRRHASLIQCPHCQEEFSSRRDLDAHLRTRPSTCISREKNNPHRGYERLTMEQEEQLKARDQYKDARVDAMKRWQYIYRVIFPSTPDKDIPSPYYNPIPHFDFKQHLLKRLPDMVARGPTGYGLADLKDRDQVVKWVETCLDNAEKEYQRSIGPDAQAAEDQTGPNFLESPVGEPFPMTEGQLHNQDYVDPANMLNVNLSWDFKDESREVYPAGNA